MTADNLTYSLEIDFIPDIKEGRDEFKKRMKAAAEKMEGTYVLDPKARPMITGLAQADVEPALKEMRLLAFLHFDLHHYYASSHPGGGHVRRMGYLHGKEDVLRFRPVPHRCHCDHGKGLLLLSGT